MIDFVSLSLFVGGLIVASFFSILLSRSAIKAALKTEIKQNTIEAFMKAMGIKSFRITDLNKLDDGAFNKLRVLLYDVRNLAGGSVQNTTGLAAQIAQLQQLGQAFSGQQPTAAKPQTELVPPQ